MSPPYLRYKDRNLLQIFEDVSQKSPNRVFATIPQLHDPQDVSFDLTFRQMARAVDFLGRWLKEQFGPEPTYDFETLTYLGVPDVRYTLIILACIKCRYKVLLLSPRNTVKVNSYLMQETRSNKILFSPDLKPVVEALRVETQNTNIIEIASLQDILEGEAEPIPYSTTFQDALNDPVVILHSSGSTGLPKPITYTNGTFSAIGGDWTFRSVEGRRVTGLPLFVSREEEETKEVNEEIPFRFFGAMPPFHLSGLFNLTIVPILSMGLPIYHPSARLPNSEFVLEMIQKHKLQGIALAPSLIEGLLHLPDGLKMLKTLDWVMFAGGPLSREAGDEISKHTTLISLYGSTEALGVRQLCPRRETWSYLEFHPDDKYRMEPEYDDIYELVTLADPDAGPEYAGTAAMNHNLPHINAYRTKDLFKKHDSLELWQFYGRKDDIIVLSSGEKINPVPMEMTLRSHSTIAGALVVGQGRMRAAILIEPGAEYRDVPKLADEIWDLVQKANENASGPARVSREMILLTDPERPFVRAGKGTIVRKLSIQKYEAEISMLFDKEESFEPPMADSLNASRATIDEVRDLIRSLVAQLLPRVAINDASNLYLAGMDSLATADLAAGVARRIGRKPWLVPNIFYTHPSVDMAASAIYAQLTNNVKAVNGYSGGSDDLEKMLEAKISEVKEVVGGAQANGANNVRPAATYEDDSQEKIEDRGLVVAITGTSGNLGSELTARLAMNPKIRRILCLDRSSNAAKKWEGKKESGFHSRVRASLTFHTIDLTQPSLALTEDALQQVQGCDIFIHNAWKVDFNQNLASFGESLEGVKNIIQLCNSSQKPPHLVLISSISSVAQLRTVPESKVDDVSACAPMGYGESKFIAEHMLDCGVGTSTSGLRGTVLRVGQIAGSSASASSITSMTAWPEKEAFPGIFRTSKALGLIPDDLPPVDWIPVDQVASVIVELSLADASRWSQRESATSSYYNVVNPQQTRWLDLLPAVRDYCGSAAQTLPLRAWIDALAAYDRTDRRQLQDKPALKTLDFVKTLAAGNLHPRTYESASAVACSPTLATLRAVDCDALRRWLSLL